ncbi:hypothetical protein [Actinomadura rubrisoli]|uniref:Uncharacterized protein n=1 Tax=Actinomadura rubrisoli TaxID=2530368 RepID=A0A4R5B3T5_9ACTN|nr:hypothetical protein [Actinomadura rubrisoli]TDD79623.1 hypothetical protein E1298_27420 [Actinomadura rubrisoli]
MPSGKLKLGVTYIFHTSAYDGSLYETSWSPWARFRFTRTLDLTLPNPNEAAPNPDQSAQPYTNTMAPPSPWKPAPSPNRAGSTPPGLFETHCTTSSGGVKVCSKAELYNGRNFDLHRGTGARAATQRSLVSGCDLANPREGFWTTRLEECSAFVLTWDVKVNETPMGIVKALVVDERKLDRASANITERINVLDVSIPTTGILSFTLKTPKVDCKPGNCSTPNVGGWQGVATWIPGAPSHSAATDVSYGWTPNSPSTQQVTKLGRQVSMDSKILIAGTTDEYSTPATFRDVVSGWENADLEKDGYVNQIRCDNTKIVNKVPTTGCVFHNYVPTYTFDAAKYPQASSHAWLIEHKLPNHPGSKADNKPLYFLPDSDLPGNRAVICPDGWAAANGDPSVLSGATDKLNCDEFAFNATYNSGGMPALAGGLNPVSSGSACVQTFATKQGDAVHLFNIDGLVPTWKEVCGRSAISGRHNSGSMAAFPAFNVNQRLLDRDPYWLNTNMSAKCVSDSATVECTMTANNK